MQKFDQKRIWVLGADVGGIGNCISWTKTSFPSFAECDVLIVDTTTLDESTLKSISFDHARRLFDEISKRFKTGLIIICVVSKSIIATTQKDSTPLTNYFWSPFAFHFDEIPLSKSIQPIDKFPLESYLKKIKELKIGLKMTTYAKSNCQSDYSIVGIITNPVQADSKIQNNNNDIFGGIFSYVYDQIPSGDMIMLPILESSEKSIQTVLEDLGVYLETPLPKWIDKINVPGLDKIQQDIDKKLDVIKKANEEIIELSKQKKNLEKYRKMLYTGDKELEQIVKDALCLLGITEIREGRRPELEDLIFDFKHEKMDLCVIEVKSSTKLIKLDDLRQAENWAWDYRNDGKKVKTLVIANAYRLDDISSSKKQRMDFKTFEEFYQKHEICILPTLTLFEIVTSQLEGKSLKREKLEKIINNSNDVLKLEDFK